MMAAARQPSWIDSLPPLRGRLQSAAPLASFTWFRVGGAAELLFRPADTDDLAALLAALPAAVPMHVIGACSNLIIRDGGLPGVTIRLARGFAGITVTDEGIVAGAGALDVTVAEQAAAAGLTGLEFLSGIPGSIGGAVAMNAGAYGGDMAGVLLWAEIMTPGGQGGGESGGTSRRPRGHPDPPAGRGRSALRLSPCQPARRFDHHQRLSPRRTRRSRTDRSAYAGHSFGA